MRRGFARIGKRLAAFAALVLALSFVVSCAEEVGDLNERFKRQEIQYQDDTYYLRRRLTTVLLAGVDKQSDAELGSNFRYSGQADFLVLVVIDDDQKKIIPVQINRDTMTEVTVVNVLGRKTGTRTQQICLAHAFGDGKEMSCELLAEAVSRYLKDVPVDFYVAMNMDGIVPFNDLIGGVRVTLNQDFSDKDPEMTLGKTLVLHGKQAEYFVRGRMTVGDGTNIQRLERQRAYMASAKTVLMDRIRANPNYVMTLFESLDEYLVTDMYRGRIINIANKAKDYEVCDILTIDGQTCVGKYDFIEFYPDEDSLMRTVIEAFFEPAN